MCCFATSVDLNIKLMAISAASVATYRLDPSAINAFARGRFNHHLRSKTLSDGIQEGKYFDGPKSYLERCFHANGPALARIAFCQGGWKKPADHYKWPI